MAVTKGDAQRLLERILDGEEIQDNILIMRGDLSRDFSIRELQDLALLDLCELWLWKMKAR